MNPIMVVRDATDNGRPAGRWLFMWCPGCDEHHVATVPGVNGDLPTGPCWGWNGDPDQPTIDGSILMTGVQWAEGQPFHKPLHHVPAGSATVCHSFVRGGQWQFLGDCTHSLAGQTVPMVPLPDWLTDS